MTTAKCHDCGAELIAPYDGKPYWCIECSYKYDMKKQQRQQKTGEQMTIPEYDEECQCQVCKDERENRHRRMKAWNDRVKPAELRQKAGEP